MHDIVSFLLGGCQKTDDEIIEYVTPFYRDRFGALSDECIELLGSSALSEELKSKLLRINIHIIEFFTDPSESLKKQAVEHHSCAIQTMHRARIPVDASIYMFAYSQHGTDSFYYMQQIPVELQKQGIDDTNFSDSGVMPEWLNDYCDEMKEYAVRKYPANIRWMKNPSFQLTELAADLDPMVIQWLEQKDKLVVAGATHQRVASSKLVMKALSKNGLALQYVKNPSRQHIETAIKQNGCAIAFVNSPSMELEELAIRNTPEAIAILIERWKAMKRLTRDEAKFARKLKFIAIQQDSELIDKIPSLRSKETVKWTNEGRRRIVRTLLANVCIALQPLDLPALMIMMILDEMDFRHMNLMTDYAKWEVITIVKHYKK